MCAGLELCRQTVGTPAADWQCSRTCTPWMCSVRTCVHSARARSHRQMSPARPPPARWPEAATPQAGASATQLTAAEWLESHLHRWQTKRDVWLCCMVC